MTYRRSILTTIMAGATLGALATTALAADIIEPTVIEAPVIKEVKPFGGWYIRGDVGYSANRAYRDVTLNDSLGQSRTGGQPATLAPFVGEYEDGYTVGGGVGAHLGQYLRADLTADYMTGSSLNFQQDLGCTVDTCTDTYSADFDALVAMANVYVDMGTYAGITPYVGAGVGFAHINYNEITQECSAPATNGAGVTCAAGAETSTFGYDGDASLRLAWSLAAGASYDVTHNVAVDAGYRFTRVEDGRMAYINSAEIKDGGLDMHQVRVGARLKLH